MPSTAPPATALSVLTAARELLADPARWCPDAGGQYAVDAEGIGVEALDGRAARWELLGAVDRCALGQNMPWYEAACALASALGTAEPAPYHVLTWHDAPGRTHADVLALLDRAIGALTARAS